MKPFANQKILGFAGYSGAGKTTLIEQLIARFARLGLRVALIKHAHHDCDIDHPGKDSYRHREAGASEVMLVSGRRWALVHELRDEPEPALEEQLGHLSPCDLILVEGFKASPIPKIEIHRPSLGRPRFPARAMNIVAVATDADVEAEVAATANSAADLPQLDLNDPDEIVGFILEFLQIGPGQAAGRPAMRRASTNPRPAVLA